ncbi:MAG: flippase-like domain-containing protein, partial [Nevskia sp.]|nr:flippase-like domain-containing protein [Nevskia sp.]
MKRAGIPALLLNALVLGVFAWAVEHYWGWARLLAPWRELEGAALALAVCGMLLSYAVRALRIYLAERDIPRGRYLACLRLILINNVVNLLLPARSGEASFPILMKRWFDIDPARATGTLIWLRLLDLHVLATIGAACAAGGWLGASSLSRLAWAAAAAAAASPLLLFALRGPLAAKLAGHAGKPAVLLGR